MFLSLSDNIFGFLIFEALLFPVVVIAVYKIYRHFYIERWPVVPARITKSDLITKVVYTKGVRSKNYVPSVTYEYQVGGVHFVSQRIKDTNYFIGFREEADAILQKYPVGSEVNARYNPRKPRDAVLQQSDVTPAVLTFGIPVTISIGMYFLCRYT